MKATLANKVETEHLNKLQIKQILMHNKKAIT